MPPSIRITNRLAVSRTTIRLCWLDPTMKGVVPSAETDIPGPGVGDGVAGVDGWLTVMGADTALASELSLAVSVTLPGMLTTRLLNVATPFTAWAVAVLLPPAKVPLLR